MPKGPFGFPRLTSFGPFTKSYSDCPIKPHEVQWYSNILEAELSTFDVDDTVFEDEYNRRYEQSFSDINEHLEHTLDIRVGDIGQILFIADETRPFGVVSETRLEWMSNNSRDEEIINGIRNIQKLFIDVFNELDEDICIYRGIAEEPARYIKTQLPSSNEIAYSTRAIEFWTPQFSTAETFAFEPIRNKEINDAVIIARKLDTSELLKARGDDYALLPKKDSITIPDENVWVME